MLQLVAHLAQKVSVVDLIGARRMVKHGTVKAVTNSTIYSDAIFGLSNDVLVVFHLERPRFGLGLHVRVERGLVDINDILICVVDLSQDSS